MCVESLNVDQRFKIVFTSLKNVPVRCFWHSASKIFMHFSFNLFCRKFLNIAVMDSVGIITDLQRSPRSFLSTVDMGNLASYLLDS